MNKLRIGYIPEHFSTPLFFAKKYGFFKQNGLNVEFHAYPGGSGHLIQSLDDKTIDAAVGLTEAFIKGRAQGNVSYNIVGTYVNSPLQWAISTGKNRTEISSVSKLEGGAIGISRYGSGSHVMSFVLALRDKFSSPFKFKVCNDFKTLRESVNEGTCDAFMWEYFTSKKYYDSGEIAYLGSLYTPWPSWVVAASSAVSEHVTGSMLASINEAIEYFNANREEAVEYIAGNLDYSAEDAAEWMKGVEFAGDVGGIDGHVVAKTVEILRQAGVEGDEKKVLDGCWLREG